MLCEIFSEHSKDEGRLVEAVEALAVERGGDVYREVFRYLFRKDMDIRMATRYWREALARWQSLSREKSGLQNVRGALLDYLHNVAGERLSSISDGLTGLYNQAYFKGHLENVLAYRRRRDRSAPLSLIFLDLDRKGFPPELRYCATGDRVLRRTADLIRIHVRGMDVAASLDTGEFAILLPDASNLQALRVAERLRSSAAQVLTEGDPSRFPVAITFSCGVVTCPENGETAQSLFREGLRQLETASLRGDAVSPEADDRRKEERKPVHSLVEFQLEEGERYRPAMTFDVSRHGIGFGCDLDLAEGKTLTLRFRRPYWSTSREFSGRIRQVGRGDGGMCRVGFEFEEEVGLFDSMRVAPTYSKNFTGLRGGY